MHLILLVLLTTNSCQRYNRDRGSDSGMYRNNRGNNRGSISRGGDRGGGSFRGNDRRSGAGGDRSMGGPGGVGGNSKQQPGDRLRRVRWDNVDLTPFRKNFYEPCPSVLNRPQSEVEKYLNKNEITVRGKDVPPPMLNFIEGGFPEFAMKEIAKQGFERPTSIQAQGWPIALSGRNMVGIAQTGRCEFFFFAWVIAHCSQMLIDLQFVVVKHWLILCRLCCTSIINRDCNGVMDRLF